MVNKCTLIDITLIIECFVSMSMFSGRTHCALSGAKQIGNGTADYVNRQAKWSNQVPTSLT